MKAKVVLQDKNDASLKTIICKRANVVRQLGRTIFQDSVRAGWIEPCTFKPGKGQRTSNASTFYLLADVERVKKRLIQGEYPTIKSTQKQKKK